MPEVPPDGRLRPADAVRAATTLVRGEHFSDGTIAKAVESGLLDAVAASLRAWYADPSIDSVDQSPAEVPPVAERPSPRVGKPETEAKAQAKPETEAKAQAKAEGGTAPAPNPPPPMCRFCGGSPAADVTFRAHRGLVVFMGFKRMDGPMCFTCGLAVYRALTTHTLCVGWWSPFSLFVFAPLTLVRNLLAVRKVKQLPPPGPGMLGPRYDPGGCSS
jgi:hypothetical protein